MMFDDYIWCYSSEGFHKVAYRQWGECTEDNVLLCCHGATRNSHDFDFLGEVLAKEGYCVVCPDVVGRGSSDHFEDHKLYCYFQYLTDLTAIIARVGAKKVDWLGTSMGGLLGIMMASQPNSVIRRLILNDMGPIVLKSALDRILAYAGKQVIFDNFQQAYQQFRVTYTPFGITREEHWLHFIKHSLKQLPDGKWTTKTDCRCAFNGYDPKHQEAHPPSTDKAGNLTFWEYWEKVQCPTLLIHGIDSDVVTADIVDKMKRYQAHMDYAAITGVGHAPGLMDFDQINVVTDWLKKTRF